MAFVKCPMSGGIFDFTTAVGLPQVGTSTYTINTDKKVLLFYSRGEISKPLVQGNILAEFKNPVNTSYNNGAYIIEPDNGVIKFNGTTSNFCANGGDYFELDDVVY